MSSATDSVVQLDSDCPSTPIPSGTSDNVERAILEGGSLQTTPSSPLSGADEAMGECCSGMSPRYTFSAQKCLELLRASTLSPIQIRRERGRFEALGLDISESNDWDFVQSALIMEVERNDCFSKLNAIKLDICELSKSVKYLTEVAENTNGSVAELHKNAPQAASAPAPGYLASVDMSSTVIEEAEGFLNSLSRTQVTDATEEVCVNVNSLPQSVCTIFDENIINFKDISVKEIVSTIKFPTKLSCGRLANYFGQIPYTYGRIFHSAAPYPRCEFMDKMFSRLHALEPDICPEEYTCLVTLYPDGAAWIPPHSDNEQAVEGSSIWTVSVGSERSLVLTNQNGHIQEHTAKLPHGSVKRMSAISQNSWRHSIPIDHTVSEPRISFTFRKIVPVSDLPPRPRAPPIKRPEHQKSETMSSFRPTAPNGQLKRIEFLSDSILGVVSNYAFHNIPNHRCVKRSCPQLANFEEFNSDFLFSEYVIISSGINDLSCYNHIANSLFELLRPKIIESCKKSTATFIFNSLLHTRHPWLNIEVDCLNQLMFQLSCELENFLFFDSLICLQSSVIAINIDDVLPKRDIRGVHISRKASHVVGTNLVTALELLASKWADTQPSDNVFGWVWPLGPSHRSSVLKHVSRLGTKFVFHYEYRRSPCYL